MKIKCTINIEWPKWTERENIRREWWYIKLCIKHRVWPYPRKLIDDINPVPLHDKTLCMDGSKIPTMTTQETFEYRKLPLLYIRIPPTYVWNNVKKQFVAPLKKKNK